MASKRCCWGSKTAKPCRKAGTFRYDRTLLRTGFMDTDQINNLAEWCACARHTMPGDVSIRKQNKERTKDVKV